MYFNSASSQLFIMFEQWKVTSARDVIGSFMTVLAIAVLYECLKGFRRETPSKMKNVELQCPRSNVSIQFSQTCIFVAELSLAYFLMLVTMTYNTWLFVAVVIGRGLGFYLVTPLFGTRIGIDDHGYSDVLQDYPLTRRKRTPLISAADI